MNNLLETCRKYSEVQKIAVAEEKGKKYTLNNKSGFVIDKYQIDGCIVQPAGTRRCDFLFVTKFPNDQQPKTAYFVELKGGDIKSALEQIRDTIRYLKSDLPNHVYKARIVGHGSVPQIKALPPYKELLQLLGHVKHFHYATNKNFSETI